jgi:hypothetical protein
VEARANPEVFAQRSLRTTPDAIVIDSGQQTPIGWERITGIAITPERAFVAVDGEYAIVLPKSALGEETFHQLVDLIRATAGRTV